MLCSNLSYCYIILSTFEDEVNIVLNIEKVTTTPISSISETS